MSLSYFKLFDTFCYIIIYVENSNLNRMQLGVLTNGRSKAQIKSFIIFVAVSQK